MIVKNPLKRELSVDERKGIIGGSQIGACIGMEGYVTPYMVYQAYNGITPPASQDTLDSFWLGHKTEPVIADFFSYRTGFDLEEQSEAFYDPEHPYLILHPDRVFTYEIDGKRYALECKNTSVHAASKWKNEELDFNPFIPYLKNPDMKIYKASGVNPQYWAQMVWYTVFGFDGVFLARMTDNNLHVYYQPSNPELEKKVFDRVLAFREKLESGWVPPTRDGNEAAAAYTKVYEGKSMSLSSEKDKENFRLLVEAYQMKSDAEKLFNERKAKILDLMQDAEYLLSDDGKALATWSLQKRMKFDEKRYKSEHPEQWSSYVEETQSRTFMIKNAAKKAF